MTPSSLPILALRGMSSKQCLIISTAFHSHYSHTNCMNYLSTCWVGIVNRKVNVHVFKRAVLVTVKRCSDRIVCSISHVDMLSSLHGCVL